jgi:hypothetical protein
MNTTPIHPAHNTVVRVRLFPAPAPSKAARALADAAAVAEVRRALNALAYG